MLPAYGNMFPASKNIFRLLEMTDLLTVTAKALPTVAAKALPISVVNASACGDGGRRSYLVLTIEQSKIQ